MKKILSVFLAIAIVFTLVGCSPDNPDRDTNNHKESTSDKTQDKTQSVTQDVTDDKTQDATDDKTQDVTEETVITRGKIQGDVYKNEILGYEFTRPESWIFATDEEIASVLRVGAEALKEDKYAEALENNAALYDMMVVDGATRSSISIGYENLAKSLATNITEQQYAEAVKRQLEAIEEVEYTFADDFETVKIGDTEFTRWSCSPTTSGVTMTQVYYLHKVDGYMSFIIATLLGDYTISDIEAMFN